MVGSPTHPNDRHRSIALRSLTSILDVGATFISLQKDPRPDDQAVLFERPEIVDLTAHLTDFGETAALVSCLDLVVTVDTSIAHLAATMECPTWIMLPHTPDYRWLRDRDDSPWYPAVRLFRQTESQSYGSASSASMPNCRWRSRMRDGRGRDPRWFSRARRAVARGRKAASPRGGDPAADVGYRSCVRLERAGICQQCARIVTAAVRPFKGTKL